MSREKTLISFAQFVISLCSNECEVSTCEIQEKAVELGLLTILPEEQQDDEHYYRLVEWLM